MTPQQHRSGTRFTQERARHIYVRTLALHSSSSNNNAEASAEAQSNRINSSSNRQPATSSTAATTATAKTTTTLDQKFLPFPPPPPQNMKTSSNSRDIQLFFTPPYTAITPTTKNKTVHRGGTWTYFARAHKFLRNAVEIRAYSTYARTTSYTRGNEPR